MMKKIGFGGGCHWCTEAVFDVLKGVSSVKQGWIAPLSSPNAMSEAIILSYDPNIIDIEMLTYIHLLTHNSTSNHSMRNKYRSGIYTFSDEQTYELQKILERLSERFDKKIVTKVYRFGSFKLNEESYQKYYIKHASKGFCTNYIDPKLKKLLQKFSKNVDIKKIKRYKGALV